jgi:hypothetical protein
MSLRHLLRKKTQRIAAGSKWRNKQRSKRKKSKRRRKNRLARGWSNLISIQATNLRRLTIINTKMTASSTKLSMTTRKSFRQTLKQNPLRPPLFNLDQELVAVNALLKSTMIVRTNLLINPLT